MNKWDSRFLEMAALIASWSKDPSTKCSAVIVDENRRIISLGFNGFPRGCSDSLELYEDRNSKYPRVLHAETNALLFAGRELSGCTIYVWPMPSCSQCAAAIVQVGISKVVTVKPTKGQESRWNFSHTRTLFSEANVQLIEYRMEELQDA